VRFPDNGYKGDYVVDVARALKSAHGDRFVRDAAAVMADLAGRRKPSG